MERMWAPWRYEWIRESAGGVTDCFICDGLKSDKDRDNLILYRKKHALIIMNRYPYSNGHLMVSPNRHLNDLRQLNDNEWKDINELTAMALDMLGHAMNPNGFNLGYNLGRTSGAGLEEHIHQHIVPRWDGDTNYMPVVGQTKVISQGLWESYDQLKETLEKMGIK